MLALVIEGLVMLGEKSQVGQFYPLVRELMDTGCRRMFRSMWPESFTLSLAKQVLSGKMDSVIKTMERNLRLI
jgi:hypothetical protein